MFVFVEHIRKLTIKFTCMFQFLFVNTVTISPLKGGVFLLTIYVQIEVSGISTNHAAFLYRPLFPFSKIQILTYVYYCQVFFAFAYVLFLLRIFLLISGVIQGTEDTDLLVLEGKCLSADSWKNKTKTKRKVKVIPNRAINRVTIDVLIFCKIRRIFPHRLKISCLI